MQMMQMTTRTAIHPLKMVAALVAFVAAMAVVLTYNASPAHAAAESCTTTAGTTTCTYASTGSEDTFEVPLGVSTVHIVAIGAPGSLGDFGDTAGRGAQVSGDLTGLVAGQKLYVNVGGAATGDRGEIGGFNGGGSSGHYGGGGGGASDVRTEPRTVPLTITDSRLIVAGGGGGSGTNATCELPEGSPEGTPDGLFPGGAGGDAGSDGGDGEPCGSLAGGTGGKAGTQSEGGAGGSPEGQKGSLGQGGGAVLFGGGGGGGYYGGGGGGDQTDSGDSVAPAGGGGGGSNLVPEGGSATITSDGPSITISYATPHTEVVDRTDDPDLLTTPSAGACTVAADNDCSLRGAINAANATAGADNITFNLDSPATITLGSALPAINDTLSIDGSGKSITVNGNNAVQVMLVNRGKTLSLNALTIANGKCFRIAVCAGGGISNEGGTLNVTNSTFSGNTGSSGGAIHSTTFGMVNITNSTFFGNTTSSPSGGGGAVSNNASSTLTVVNSTFSGNTSNFGANISNVGTATLKNTISADGNGGTDCLGTITADTFNLDTDGSCGGATTSPSINLGALQNNGGPTKTMALQEGSPAIDQGKSDLATDQRGEDRPFDDPGIAPATGGDDSDIGAFEAQSVLNTAPQATDDAYEVNEDDTLTLNALDGVLKTTPTPTPATRSRPRWSTTWPTARSPSTRTARSPTPRMPTTTEGTPSPTR